MKIRVVLADDHRMLREALRSTLEKEPDIEVVGEAADGSSTLKVVRDLEPDVIVLDVAMPEMNGMDAAARIFTRFPKTKIIALSAYSDKRYVEQMLKAGAVGYVVKASAGTELLRAIRAAAAGETYVCPEVANILVSDLKAQRNKAASTAAPLSRREREVLQLLAEGHRSPAIAERLFISVATVDAHRRNMMRKLNLHTVADLTRYAIREGLTSP